MKSDDALPLSLEQKVDRVCARFEAAWKSGARPRIEDHLADLGGVERREVLRELILLDVFYRRKRGHSCRPKDYHTRFPELAAEWLASALAEEKAAAPRVSAAGGATADWQPAAAPGVVIAGRYTLVETIGEGGMGEVWVAKQTVPVKRKVALKLIKAGMDSKTVLARFEAERQALALMDHPNIAKVLDGGITAAGHPFFVMELVNGMPLTKFCDEARLTLRERLELFVPICQAVQHAHHKGIVHRDLKPSNILVTLYDGKAVPKVIDFGVAKAVAGKLTDESLSTQWGAVVGTLEYLAPEQAGLSAIDIDTRADIYSLGVILYELLTGLRPFDAKRLRRAALDELIRILREEEPSKPSTRLSSNEALPSLAALRHTEPKRLVALMRGELDCIVMKALEKDRNRRYETANGFATDVQRYLSDEPVQACPPSAMYRFRKFARRNKVGLAIVALVVYFLVLVGGVGLVGYATTAAALHDAQQARDEEGAQRIEAERQEGIARQAQRKAERQEKEAVHREKEVRRQRDEINGFLYAAQMPQAYRAWGTGDLTRLRQMLEQHRPRPGWADHRAWEWHYLDALTQGHLWVVRGHTEPVLALAWTADGRRLASADGNGTVKVWDVTTGRETSTLRSHGGSVTAISWSPDGRRLASAGADSPHSLSSWPGNATVKVWDVAAGKEILNLKATAPWAPGSPAPAWSQDGQRLAIANPDGAIRVWELATGKEVLCLRAHFEPAKALSWSPDGTRLASVGRDGLAKVWEAATGKQAFTLRELVGTNPITDTVAGLAWTADAKQLVAAQSEGKMIVWDMTTGAEFRNQKLYTPAPAPFSVQAMSPNGKRLAGYGDREKILLWDTESGKKLMAVRFHEGAGPMLGNIPLPLAWSPNGEHLAKGSADGAVRLWKVSAVRDTDRTIHTGSANPPVWSAGGRALIAPDGKGAIRVWDAVNGEVTRTLAAAPVPRAAFQDFVFAVVSSPAGRQLASASNAGAIRVLDAATGQFLRSLENPPAPASGVAWSPDGGRLAVSRSNGIVEVWDASTGKEALTIPGIGGVKTEIAWSPDGERLASSGAGTIKVWDAATGKEVYSVSGQATGRYFSMAWSPDSGSFASISYSPTKDLAEMEEVKVWDAARGKATVLMRRAVKYGKRGLTVSLGWSPAGRWLATHQDEGVIKVWDAAKGTEILALPCAISSYSIGSASSTWSPDGKRLATITGDGTIKVVDPATGKESLSIRSQPATWFATRNPRTAVMWLLAWSPDGRRLASAVKSTSKIKNVWEAEGNVWDASTGKDLLTLHPDPGVGQLAWSRDGRQLAAVSSDQRPLKVWDTTSGKETLIPAPAKGAWSWLSWGPDARRLAVGNFGTVQVWDAPPGEQALTPPLALYSIGTSLPWLVAWNKDGRRLAVANPDWTVKVVDATTGKEALSLGRSRGEVRPGMPPENRVVLAWEPHGKRLASSAGLERTIQVWDPATGANLLTLPGHSVQIRSLAWSRDGKRLASAGDDGTVKVWDVTTGKEILSLPYLKPNRSLSQFPKPPSELLLAWNPDGGQLAVAGGNGAVTVWNVQTGKEAVTLYGSKASVASVAWSPDGLRLASASVDGSVSLWDPGTGQEVLTLRLTLQFTAKPASLSWSPDGRRLALAIDEPVTGSVMVWDAPGAEKPGPEK